MRMCVAGPCRDVVAQHDERFGAFACRDDIEYATDVAAIVAQCVAGARSFEDALVTFS